MASHGRNIDGNEAGIAVRVASYRVGTLQKIMLAMHQNNPPVLTLNNRRHPL